MGSRGAGKWALAGPLRSAPEAPCKLRPRTAPRWHSARQTADWFLSFSHFESTRAAESFTLASGPLLPSVQVGYNAEFYSGADLAALLAEAQLAAVHEALEAEEAEHAAASAAAAAADGEGEAGTAVAARRPHTHPKPHARTAPRPPVIQARHLQAALAAARPSVPEAERERLEAVYARFRQDRQPGQAAGVDKGKGKLVSWA